MIKPNNFIFLLFIVQNLHKLENANSIKIPPTIGQHKVSLGQTERDNEEILWSHYLFFLYLSDSHKTPTRFASLLASIDFVNTLPVPDQHSLENTHTQTNHT